MKRLYGAVVAAALLSASGAWAVKVGDDLYIKAKGVKLLKEPKPTSTAIGKELAVGEVVRWKGASEKDKSFHEIEVSGKKGFVLMSNLSPSKPQMEIAEAGKGPLDTKAFASSGAATKGLTNAALTYSETKGPDMKKAAVQVIYAEEHNKNKGTPEAIAMKSKELGGGK